MVNFDRYMEMVPLYVNGSLAPTLVREFEEIVPTSPELSRELRECEEISAACVTVSRESPSPSPDLFTRISARLKDDRTSVDSQAWLSFKPVFVVIKNILSWPGLGWGLAVVQMALLVFIFSGPVTGQRYHTLAEIGHGDINLIFTADTSEADIRGLLTGIGASIISGPSPEGLYVIRLKTKNPAALVLEIKKNRHVRFVGMALK